MNRVRFKRVAIQGRTISRGRTSWRPGRAGMHSQKEEHDDDALHTETAAREFRGAGRSDRRGIVLLRSLLLVVTVKGASMTPTLRHQDRVLVLRVRAARKIKKGRL